MEDNGLDENFPIGKSIDKFRLDHNGTVGKLTDEEIEVGENLEILKKKEKNVTPPLFKGRKISQFHVDFINENLSKILSGELNTREVLELLKQASISKNETIIKDARSIKRIVEMLLKDKPDELEKYNKIVKRNSGRRSTYKGKIGKPKLGYYYSEELKFKQLIIDKYLPQILNGETTFKIIENELSIAHQTVDAIVNEYYAKNNDSEGLQKYLAAKSKNAGVSLEARKNAKEMRKEIAEYDIVSQAEFLLLSSEKQLEQVMMKIRMNKLKEEVVKEGKTAVLKEETTKKRIEATMKYFNGKNDFEHNRIYFSDEDIRYMIFRYPTLISRSPENLDEKLYVLTSYEEISKETAYGIIKSFPAIMGYDASRTKKQLDLLESEKLMDYVKDKPSGLMSSVSLMYALIQYAKERHETSDLSEVNRSNIFMANSTLKRLYKTSYAEIKAKFPYEDKEQDSEYTISTEDIGQATYTARDKSIEAGNILDSIIQNEKGQR